MVELFDNHFPTLFLKLGFTEASRMNGGVYHLKSNSIEGTASHEYIALLYSPEPITSNTKSLQLFLQHVPNPLPIDVYPSQIQLHWQTLDARRLEESGLDPITVYISMDEKWEELTTLKYPRPDDSGRFRYCVQLPTSDVVCYN